MSFSSLVSLTKTYINTKSEESVLEPYSRTSYPIHGVSRETHEVNLIYGDDGIVTIPGVVIYIHSVNDALYLVLFNETSETITIPSYQRIARLGISHVCSHPTALPSLSTPIRSTSVPELKVVMSSTYAKLPSKGTEGSACFDLTTVENGGILPGQRKLFDTGLMFGIPPGYCVRILSRSGLASRNGIDVQAGTIDSDYRGKVGILLHNTSTVYFEVNRGDKIAQMMFVQLPSVSIVEVSSLDATVRGSGGFGSTGK